MRVRIEIDSQLDATEVVITAPAWTDEIKTIYRQLETVQRPSMTFYKGTGEYFLSLDEIFFFETEGAKIYGHTKEEVYEVRFKLYDLEAFLPSKFSRISKSTIANLCQVYAIENSFSGTSTLAFYDTQGSSRVSPLLPHHQRKTKRIEVSLCDVF